MGWLTTEELVLRTTRAGCSPTRPSTYKIPVASRRAGAISTSRCSTSANREDTIYRSKAVGEPPLMLAISRLLRASPTRSTRSTPGQPVPLDAPATPEAILRAVRGACAGGRCRDAVWRRLAEIRRASTAPPRW